MDSVQLERFADEAAAEARALMSQVQSMERLAAGAAKLSTATSQVVDASASGVDVRLQGNLTGFSTALGRATSSGHDAVARTQALARRLHALAQEEADREREAARRRQAAR